MPAVATVLWAQAREKHMPSYAKNREPCLVILLS